MVRRSGVFIGLVMTLIGVTILFHVLPAIIRMRAELSFVLKRRKFLGASGWRLPQPSVGDAWSPILI